MTERERADALFRRLALRARNPRGVQRLLRALAYNRERRGETLHSAAGAWRRKRAHCLEAALVACAVMEKLGFPAQVLSLESADNLDHVICVFQEKGRWGAIGRSRDEGLHGRAPVFRDLAALVKSYWEPYVDQTGRITGYGLAPLDALHPNWRHASGAVWAVEKKLIHWPHRRCRQPEATYQKAKARYLRHRASANYLERLRKPFWW